MSSPGEATSLKDAAGGSGSSSKNRLVKQTSVNVPQITIEGQQSATSRAPGSSHSANVGTKLGVAAHESHDPSATGSRSGNIDTSISKQNRDWDGASGIGIMTSESPDSVAAWRGRKRTKLYGKPRLACDESSRVLVLPEPVYMLWPDWMKMNDVDSPSRSDTFVMETEDVESAEAMGKWKRLNSHPRPQDAEHFLRSNFQPNAVKMPFSKPEN